ncbi:MAG TPA: type I polyketide synthase [Candidatus Sulfopaludibacter sp.]|jgi:acyl transferase domain-containing protein|nr:type I polyketide synthase [Candidatus Sulfopaludibacter sp.]
MATTLALERTTRLPLQQQQTLRIDQATHMFTTREDYQYWLVDGVARLLGLAPDELDARERFSQYGLDSAKAIRLMASLASESGRSLSPTLMWDYPTIESLSEYLAGAARPAAATVSARRGAAVNEPIAVIGMACRFPQAPDLESFWRLLAGAGDAMRDVPASRWSLEEFFDADLTAPGKINARQCGFVDGIDEFDPQFFGISPKEAAQMDPQQRLFLELASEAIADAAIPAERLQGSRTGVYAGVVWNDYAKLHEAQGGVTTSHTGPGQAFAVIANRVSYAFGLHGPSIALDTACSSSLVAVHLACQSLRAGESSMALAGGVNVILSPGTMVTLTKFGGLSPDSRCKAFDADADGFARGEGGGVVVLKRLSDALAEGDPIYCVIRGSAMNNDGASNGLAAPNPRAQEMVLREACANAGVSAADVQYVEAHGTGTALGDPIEAGALGAVHGAGRSAENPLLVGSVKTNIGHLEAASGIAGFIKVALAMKHGAIPASLHFRRASEYIDFAALRVRVQTELTAWPVEKKAALAGVSSFGWGGVNCHIVMEGVEAAGKPGRATESGEAAVERKKLAFVFSAQGSQWWGMGRDLLRTEPAFRVKFQECDRIFSGLAGFSLMEELLTPERARTGDVAAIQPLLFAMQVSLAALWEHWGIRPDAVVGHSLGEVAAAHVAGILTLEDAVLVIHHYSRLQATLANRGGMALVELAAEDVAAYLGSGLCIAGYNSPTATVVSGGVGAIAQILAELTAKGIFGAQIQVNLAAHSEQIDGISEELTECLRSIRPGAPSIPMRSTLTGEVLREGDVDAGYWARNLRHPVRFTQAIAALGGEGFELFVEVSPHPIALPSIQQTLPGATLKASLRRQEDAHSTLLEALGAMQATGKTVRWDRVDGGMDSGAAETSEIFTLSGRSAEAVREWARKTAEWLESGPRVSLEDLCYSASVARSHHEHRFACVARSTGELARSLRAFAEGEVEAGAAAGRKNSQATPVAFVFCGHGPQWWGMGRELLASEPVFRAAMAECDRCLRVHAGWSLLEELGKDEGASRIDETIFAQPAIFAIQVSLAALWQAWGVTPGAVIGHSMGEVAAACVAGALSVEDGVRVIAFRARLLQESVAKGIGSGKMAAVEMGPAEAEELVARFAGKLWIAAVNSPVSIVLSGEAEAIDAVCGELAEKHVLCRVLRVDYTSHGGPMGTLQPLLERKLAGIEARTPRIPAVSTVTGVTSGAGDFSPEYWALNLREPVRFGAGLDTLMDAGYRHFVEISPHPVLAISISQCLEARGKEGMALASLRRGQAERASLLASLAQLYAAGGKVEWSAVYPAGRFVRMPGYPFQRQRYWFEIDGAAAKAAVPAVRQRSTAALPVYQVMWKALVDGGHAARSTSGRWIVFTEDGGVGDALARGLQVHGASRVTIFSREAAQNPERLQQEIRALGPVAGAVYLWGLALADAEAACTGALQMVRALAGQPVCKVWLVTRGAEAAGGTLVDASTAPLGGIGRGISLEHPDLWGGLVDLDPASSARESAEALLREVLALDEEDQVALRHGSRYAPRLVAIDQTKAAAGPAIRPDASYLITGGNGSLGITVAEWLAEQGAKYIVLSSRSGISSARMAAVDGLRRRGVQVMASQADVADADEMRRLFQEMDEQFPPLRGIVHSAGVLTRHAIEDLDGRLVRNVFRPKVAGAWNLHSLTLRRELDFFVCFSSGASVWGSNGMAHYSAANRYLDALTHHRRALGLPALSINWGAWEGESMATAAEKAQWSAIGLRELSRAEGMECMRLLMACGTAQAVAASIDWAVFKPIYEARGRRRLLDEIRVKSVEQTGARRGGMRKKVEAASPVERREMVQDYLRAQAAKSLGVGDARAIDCDQGFFQMGMDSMMAVALKTRLETDLDCALARTVVFEYPTVKALAGMLCETLFPAVEMAQAAAASAGGTELLLQRIRELREELR